MHDPMLSIGCVPGLGGVGIEWASGVGGVGIEYIGWSTDEGGVGIGGASWVGMPRGGLSLTAYCLVVTWWQ